jgi:hypothetical protein
MNLKKMEGLVSLGIKAKKDELVAPPTLQRSLDQDNILNISFVEISQQLWKKEIENPSGPRALSG